MGCSEQLWKHGIIIVFPFFELKKRTYTNTKAWPRSDQRFELRDFVSLGFQGPKTKGFVYQQEPPSPVSCYVIFPSFLFALFVPSDCYGSASLSHCFGVYFFVLTGAILVWISELRCSCSSASSFVHIYL